MRNKVLTFVRGQQMLAPGDTLICAVSGGADSMALLWAMYLLREKLQIRLEAAHFNHNLRGAESDGDAAFVEDFCRSHGIYCHMGSAQVAAGPKGLEAAARAARYGFLESLPGKIATAHTADDNAETLLMHLLRGTGLTGLGGIAPIRGNLIRPMLTVTRKEVEQFLEQEKIPYRTDSSNLEDTFLRNRLRHHVMPLLQQENQNIAAALSATALRLRRDDEALDALSLETDRVDELLAMSPAIRSRVYRKLLISWGVPEPEAGHVQLLDQVVQSQNPSAFGVFPGGVIVARNYDRLVKQAKLEPLGEYPLQCPGRTPIPQLGAEVVCTIPGQTPRPGSFRVHAVGEVVLRSRKAGDTITLPGGTKRLKKLFIDRKIPAARRETIPVIADRDGVLAVAGIGPDVGRTASPNWEITIETVSFSQG